MTEHRKCRFEIRRARSEGQAAKLGVPADFWYPLDQIAQHVVSQAGHIRQQRRSDTASHVPAVDWLLRVHVCTLTAAQVANGSNWVCCAVPGFDRGPSHPAG